MSTREFLLSAWTWSPVVLTACATGVIAYAWLWQAAAGTRGDAANLQIIAAKTSSTTRHEFNLLPRVFAFDLRVSAFLRQFPYKLLFLLVALAVFVLTLASPLEQLAEGYLFSAHMLQHLLLLLIVPAFLLIALPDDLVAPRQVSARLPLASDASPPPRSSTLALLLMGWTAGVGSMWLWHVPSLCNAAATSYGVRAVQTLSLLILGGFFWWPIIGPHARHRLSPLPGIAYLFTACTACTLLGILITFAPVSVCSVYLHPKDPIDLLPLIRDTWGLSARADQQIGGLLMWVPACLIYLSGILGLLRRWYKLGQVTMREPEASSQAA